jgi:enoyl-CoA hydratase/carnithine racemase
MTSYAAFTVDVPNMGTVAASFIDAKTISVHANRALLHDGLLYSLNATLGQHGDGWYPVSGVTVTGMLGKNAPKKVADPVSEAATAAVNEYLAANPAHVRVAREQIYSARIKSLQRSVEYQQDNVNRYTRSLDEARADLQEHLAAQP